jgi:SAM-dependent methyltransferase
MTATPTHGGASLDDFEAFVRAQLPEPPARVLEIGCGSGELALTLAEAGYDMTAIDPAAPSGPIFRRLKLEDLEPTEGPFEGVVASRSLHHVANLGVALDRIVALLPLGGPLVLDEFAWDRLDLETADWYYGQLRALAAAGRGAEVPPSLDACCRDWQEEHVGLHGYTDMRAELDARFEERLFLWTPYLHRLLDGEVSAQLEEQLIASGGIRATGFRYVGIPRTATAVEGGK